MGQAIAFLSEEGHGESQRFFVRSILRVGGDRGYEVLESLHDDPVVGQAATPRLKRRRKVSSAR